MIIIHYLYMKNLFKKAVSLLVLSIFLTLGASSPVLAQSELLFGQDHSYSVVFRGNGEAIVYAKLVVTNPDNKPLTEFSFEVPKVIPTEMTVYQMKLPQTCTQFSTTKYYTDPPEPRTCLKYEEPDYSSRYYGSADKKAEYTKIEPSKSGNLYRFTLPTPVASYKSTAIIVAYATKGYVNNVLGLSQFKFETLKVPSRIQNVRVSVDVDSDLILKDRKAEVNYGTTGVGAESFGMAQTASSPKLDSAVRSIGSNGVYVKEAKNLSPNESFVVKGEYAKNWFRLYLGSILLTLLILAGIVTGGLFLFKFLKQRQLKMGNSLSGSVAESSSVPSKSTRPMASMILLISFCSVFVVLGLTFLLVYSNINFSYLFGYNPVLELVIGLILVMIYILVIIGPALYLSTKSDWKSLIWVLVADILWFIFFVIIYAILFQTVLSPRNSYSRSVTNDVLYK